jgi:hypothetical protein
MRFTDETGQTTNELANWLSGIAIWGFSTDLQFTNRTRDFGLRIREKYKEIHQLPREWRLLGKESLYVLLFSFVAMIELRWLIFVEHVARIKVTQLCGVTTR